MIYFPNLRGHVTLNTYLSQVIYRVRTYSTLLYQSVHGFYNAYSFIDSKDTIGAGHI